MSRSASTSGGGVFGASRRRTTSAAPSQRSAWKASACVPGRAASGVRGERVVERSAGAHRGDSVGGVTEETRQRQRGGRWRCGHADKSTAALRRTSMRYAREPRQTERMPHGRREAHPDLSQRRRPGTSAGLGPHPLPAGRRRLPLSRQRQHRRLRRGRRARRVARRGRGADAGRAARARDRHRERPQHQRHREAGRQDVPDRGLQGPLHRRRPRSPSSRTSRA